MSAAELTGLMVGAYLALLARSAWKQGEFRQFARGLAFVLALLGTIAAVVWLAIWLDGGW